MLGMFDDLIGKPFKYNSFGPNEYDCYGLCKEVCRRGGLDLPDQEKFIELHTPYPDYEVRGNDRISLVDKCAEAAIKNWFKKIDNPEPYCIVVFNSGPYFAGHVGVAIDKKRFIHIFPKKNCCIERLDNPKWVNKIEGFYRYVSQSG
jgi:cell wall-associated NlpC family hydrolase